MNHGQGRSSNTQGDLGVDPRRVYSPNASASLSPSAHGIALPANARSADTQPFEGNDTIQQPEGSRPCSFQGCEVPILSSATLSWLRNHFNKDHQVTSDYVQCPWFNTCKTPLRPMKHSSIAKHLANSHLNANSQICRYCFKELSTIDALHRHHQMHCLVLKRLSVDQPVQLQRSVGAFISTADVAPEAAFMVS